MLGKLTSQLEAAGMSHTGAAEMADAIQHGAVPSELVRDAAKASQRPSAPLEKASRRMRKPSTAAGTGAQLLRFLKLMRKF